MKKEHYTGKYMQPGKSPARRPKRLVTLLVSLLLVLGVVVGGTIAFIHTRTEQKVNTFTPSRVASQVTEDFDNNVKSNVAVKNTGDTTAYIRAAINVTWMKDAEAGTEYDAANQTVSAKIPVEGKDYSITLAQNTNWIKGADGYYYYQLPVNPKDSTKVLIEECTLLKDASVPDGYHLSVEIVASAIQAAPEAAVKAAWGDGFSIDASGNLVVPSSSGN